MNALLAWLTGHHLHGGLSAAPDKNLGSSDAQHPEPRGQTVPDSGKFWAAQRVPPQVGSIRVAMRLITCATCTSPPAYPCKACTGGARRNAHLSAAMLTSQGQRLALPGGAVMQ